MKIRLIGSADLVRALSAEMARAYGIKGAEYPSRHGGDDIRVYFDLDDRQAAALVGLTGATAAVASAPAPGSSHRGGRRRLKG